MQTNDKEGEKCAINGQEYAKALWITWHWVSFTTKRKGKHFVIRISLYYVTAAYLCPLEGLIRTVIMQDYEQQLAKGSFWVSPHGKPSRVQNTRASSRVGSLPPLSRSIYYFNFLLFLLLWNIIGVYKLWASSRPGTRPDFCSGPAGSPGQNMRFIFQITDYITREPDPLHLCVSELIF